MKTLKLNQNMVLAVLVIFNSCFLFPQNEAFKISSPEAAGSGSNDSSVDMTRGVNTTSIPLYTYQGREFDFPISISNSSTGIKVEQLATCVGLGWNLNVGGRITRNVILYPDDGMDELASPPTLLEANYYSEVHDYYHIDTYGINDYFKYFLDLQVKCITNPTLKITTPNGFLHSGIGTEFIVETLDGTQFFFGQNNTCEVIESYKSSTGNLFTKSSNSWLLTKIISKNKLDIYEITYVRYQWNQLIPGRGEEIANKPFSPSYYKSDQLMVNNIFHNGVKIIHFEYQAREDLPFASGEGNALKEIQILKHNTAAPLKRIAFGYDYFGNSQSLLFYEKRLRLKNLTFNGYDDVMQNWQSDGKFSFEYFNDQEVTLPSIMSPARDFLGLFNGQNSNSNLLPPLANRNFNLNAALTGTLQKITYPNGGTTTFEYEQHSTTTGGVGTYTIPEHTETQQVNNPIYLINIGQDNIGSWMNCPSLMPNSNYEDWNQSMQTNAFSQYPNSEYNDNVIRNCREVFTSLMRVNEAGEYNMDTTGEGVFLIHKIDSNTCGNENNDIITSCDNGYNRFNNCLTPTNQISYTGNNLVSGDFGGVTGLPGNNVNHSTIQLEIGVYQVTLWKYGQIGIDSSELSGINLIIYKNNFSTQTIITPPRVITYSNQYNPNIDGFRIKSIKNNEKTGEFISKKKYDYVSGLPILNTIENSIPRVLNASTTLYTYTSRGYPNPDLIYYEEVVESSVDSNNNNLGYTKYTFQALNGGQQLYYINKPFNYSGRSDEIVRATYEGIRTDKPILKRVYNKNDNLVESTTMEYTKNPFYLPAPFWYYYNTPENSTNDNPTIDIEHPYNQNILESKTTTTPEGIEFHDEYLYDEENKVVEIYKTNDHIRNEYNNPLKSDLLTDVFSDQNGHTQFNYTQINGRFLLTSVAHRKNENLTLQTIIQYNYDDQGNRVETINYAPGILTPASYESYIYGYNNRFVVAKLTGVKYNDIPFSLITQIKTMTRNAVSDSNDAQIRSALNQLRQFPNALITSYTYNPNYGMTSVTDPKGYSVFTDYDALGRIKQTKEENPLSPGQFNILSSNEYFTKNQ